MKVKFAKFVRFITIPPFIVSLLALILSITGFIMWIEVVYIASLLGLVGVLA